MSEDSTSGDTGDAGGAARETKYCSNCGEEIDAKAEVCPECGVRQASASDDGPDRIAAALLAIFLGGIGVHKFYLGQTKMGILYLCFFWTAIPALVGFIEGIIYLTKSDEEFRRRYAQ
ncbi:zinc-ribbon domain and TM2 domain-containing protein [Halocalculus aciditolerans]|uniref:TM2 domain-containing protein n=1 Tax=Halocalculus aciditolerans TaxID=1383812 RepID=A0A830FME3_9EURY|nr:TM2 domain-containing protein [Halocalculus aciditolerans]GGL70179.1 hypothetical protein GCM10009039_30250 [Halocalculus aciditolerans]